jgi:3-phosphoshikimate 1-carboxyvinyltransferase
VTVERVRPGIVAGSIRAPPSKSYTHRALVAGHLTGRPYRVRAPLVANDTRATARALRALGSRVSTGREVWDIRPRSNGRRLSPSVDCGESGTTLRFVAALAARSSTPVTLRGRGRLPERPIVELFDALETLGARCTTAGAGRSLPATVRGPIRGGPVRLDASVSSQFVSALLLTLPTVAGESTLDLAGPIVSEPYIEATLAVLRHHRVEYRRRGRRFTLPGDQAYLGRGMSVPGDASSAAYLWTAAAVTGGRVRVDGVPSDWPQADLAILGVLRSAGASVHRASTGATVEGGPPDGFSVDLTPSPDLFPLVGALAATIPRRSELRGAEHVVHKESDRRTETIRLARAMGATVSARPGLVAIRGRERPCAFRLDRFTDHRLVMSAAVGALAADGESSVGDARAVGKSFPGFWRALGALRGGPAR